MSEAEPEADPATAQSDSEEEVQEPAAMGLESPEVDYIELSQDGGETFEGKSNDGGDH
ncbi:MAG: hypothetical protein WA966_08780 [Ornithinimicrobium sp.]